MIGVLHTARFSTVSRTTEEIWTTGFLVFLIFIVRRDLQEVIADESAEDRFNHHNKEISSKWSNFLRTTLENFL